MEMFCDGGIVKVNERMEAQEKERKDIMKKRREETVQSESLALKCEVTGCSFVGLSKAGLVNHVQQRHGRLARVKEKCPFCEHSVCKQGLSMHKRFCQANPNRGRRS